MRISGSHAALINKEPIKTDSETKKKPSSDTSSHLKKLVIDKNSFSNKTQLKETIYQIILNFAEENKKV